MDEGHDDTCSSSKQRKKTHHFDSWFMPLSKQFLCSHLTHHQLFHPLNQNSICNPCDFRTLVPHKSIHGTDIVIMCYITTLKYSYDHAVSRAKTRCEVATNGDSTDSHDCPFPTVDNPTVWQLYLDCKATEVHKEQ